MIRNSSLSKNQEKMSKSDYIQIEKELNQIQIPLRKKINNILNGTSEFEFTDYITFLEKTI